MSWRHLALASLALVIALNLAAFAVRGWFVTRSGSYAVTTGFEEFNLYHLWKAAEGHPLYEWPERDNYTPTHYNAAFYHAYAAWTRLWGARGEETVACARWLTPFFAVLGMLMQAHLLRQLAPETSRGSGLWRWGIAFLTWFGPTFGAWWVWSVRADIPAVVLSLTGFASVLRAREQGGLRWWLAGSLLFFAAWSFKQYVVWIYAGAILHVVLFGGGWRVVAALLLPFGLLTLAAFYLGGDVYLHSLLVVPGYYRWLPPMTLELLSQAILFNTFFWLCALGALVVLVRRSSVDDIDIVERRWRIAAVVSVPALGMGIVQLTPPGSNINNMLEGFVMVGLLGGAWWLRRWPERSKWLPAAGAVALLSMAPLTAVQLALGAQGIPIFTVKERSVGNVIKLNAAQLDQRRRFGEWMRTLPRPVWIDDAMLQLPWFTTGGSYPAPMMDFQFEADVLRAGAMEGAGFVEMISARRFGSLLLREHSSDLLRVALRVGYVERPLPEDFYPLADPYGVRSRHRFFVRP